MSFSQPENSTRQPHTGEIWDVIVVGAGPAGSVAALSIAKQGRSVLLLEKHAWPRNKVCGGCLNPAAISVLERLGIDQLDSVAAAPEVNKLQIHAYGNRMGFQGRLGRSVNRYDLDRDLVERAVQAGCDFRSQVQIREMRLSGTERILSGKSQTGDVEFRGRLVILASGLGSPLAKQANVAMQVKENARIGLGAWHATAPCGGRAWHDLHELQSVRLCWLGAVGTRCIRCRGCGES